MQQLLEPPEKAESQNGIRAEKQSGLESDTRPREKVASQVSKQSETNQVKRQEYHPKNAVQQMDSYIDIDPQLTFVPNCKFQEADKAVQDTCVLAWNAVGTVTLRRQLQFTSIDVDFTDKTFHRNLSINDDFNCSMACVNYSGLMVASKAEVQDLDNYEEDEEQPEPK